MQTFVENKFESDYSTTTCDCSTTQQQQQQQQQWIAQWLREQHESDCSNN